MPVLHQYKDRNEFYILTSIKGNIITFHLTPGGQNKLFKAGIEPEQTFNRAILLDLYRSGEVFTYGNGPGKLQTSQNIQCEFDFSDDPEPDTLFPACASCSSINDLHLVELKENPSSLSILCSPCRVARASKIDTSIPLTFVTTSVLGSLSKLKCIEKEDDSVFVYRALLNAELEKRWSEIMRRPPIQEVLFPSIDIDKNNLFK